MNFYFNIKYIFNIIIFLILLFSIIIAIMISRTAQGAIAWLISLITFPYLSIPIFWILSCPKFCGYIIKKNILNNKKFKKYTIFNINYNCNVKLVEKLAMLPLTKANYAKLLINGYITFKSMFDGIKRAKKYILIQFFIIKNDKIGQKLKNFLIYSAKKGVKIFFIYDNIGSYKLSNNFIKELRKAGIKIFSFGFCKGWKNFLKINFCNHRKLIIVDGKEGWTGGLNIGIEYLGIKKKIGYWRDTHLHIIGPSVLCLQEIFLEDWYWTTGKQIKFLNWKPLISKFKNQHIIIVPSGPVYNINNASLLIQNSINIAKKKFWITSPYFIPDQSVIDSLKLAALRGVDVKIIIPERTDHLLVYLSTFSFLADLIKFGVKIYKYIKGFLHQKVMLIDDHTASVGTINLDNRSFRLNFEITAYIIDSDFAKDVYFMLKQDLLYCKLITLNEINCRSLINKLISKAAFLASPIQ